MIPVTSPPNWGTRLAGTGFFRFGLEANNHGSTNRAGDDTVPDWLADPTPANLALRGHRNYAAGDPKAEIGVNGASWYGRVRYTF